MTQPIQPKRIELLLIEDNPGDARLIQEILREAQTPNRLNVTKDGVDALAFLRRPPAGRRPDLILLDLNLPKMNGLEVLAVVKQDAGLRRIPVVILSTSADERDVARCYDLQANCYIVKPVELENLIGVIRFIEEFWFKVVTLPPGAPGGR